MPNQYCRYCANAEGYNGDGTDFVCFADILCGDGGSGIFYSATKEESENRCKHYAFCGIDIFTAREYQPRVPREMPPDGDYIQTSLL